MPSRFCTYLGTTDILKLCFVSTMIRQIILRVFHKTFNVSEGFCSAGCWFQLIKMNCFCLIEDINANFFEDRFIFDFDEYYSKMLKEFTQNMSLFSICLHFLLCICSCDKKSYYCHLCSRVHETFFRTECFYKNVCVSLWNIFIIEFKSQNKFRCVSN